MATRTVRRGRRRVGVDEWVILAGLVRIRMVDEAVPERRNEPSEGVTHDEKLERQTVFEQFGLRSRVEIARESAENHEIESFIFDVTSMIMAINKDVLVVVSVLQ